MKRTRRKAVAAIPEHHRTLRAIKFPVERAIAAYEVVRRTDALPLRYYGRTVPPEQMTACAPADKSPDMVAAGACDWLRALVGTGPNQTDPHTLTADAIGQGLARLRDFAASGDADAMRNYGRILSEAVTDLSELARRHPETVRAWSASVPVVPVLTGRNRGHKSDLEADLDAFAVGTASRVRVNHLKARGGKTFNARTPAVFLAGMLMDCMNGHSKALAFYSEPVPKWLRLYCAIREESTAEQWAEAAWEYLVEGTDGHPENYFWDLGKNKATNLRAFRATDRANVRAEIRQSIREAFVRMLR